MNAVSSRVTSKKENLDLKHSSGWSPRQKPLTWTQLPTVEFRSARLLALVAWVGIPTQMKYKISSTYKRTHTLAMLERAAPLKSIIGQGQINVCGVNEHPKNVRYHTVLTLEGTPPTTGYNWGKLNVVIDPFVPFLEVLELADNRIWSC